MTETQSFNNSDVDSVKLEVLNYSISKISTLFLEKKRREKRDVYSSGIASC